MYKITICGNAQHTQDNLQVICKLNKKQCIFQSPHIVDNNPLLFNEAFCCLNRSNDPKIDNYKYTLEVFLYCPNAIRPPDDYFIKCKFTKELCPYRNSLTGINKNELLQTAEQCELNPNNIKK